MIAEACRFYGWTMDYVLNMPAVQFFYILDRSRQIQAHEYINLCDIAAIPLCNSKYFESVRGKFERMLERQKIQEYLDSQNNPGKIVLKAESKEAKHAMLGLFHSIKRD